MTDTCQLLASYELGLLPRDETHTFEQHLESCSSCLLEMYDHSNCVTAIHEEPGRILKHPALHVSRATGLSDVEDTGSRQGQIPSTGSFIDRLRHGLSQLVPRTLSVPIGITATAIAVLGLFIHLQSQDPSFGDLAQVQPLEYVRLEVRGDLQRDLDIGLSSYAEADYGTAVVHLERALQHDRTLDIYKRNQIHLYLGVAYILSNQRPKAYPHLEAAAESSLLVITDRAYWYLAQASLQDENPQAAAAYLQRLAGKSPVYGDSAELLLREIEQMIGTDPQ